MEDDDWEAGLWTDAKRDDYLASGERAIAALRDHLALVAACSSDADEPRIDDSAERVREAYIALSQAEFDYSTTLAPFGLLETEDDEEDLEEVPLDPEAEHNQISILIRRDYAVTSEADVLRAGREAYSKVWPDDTVDQANEDVQDLGRALYQVMHAGGVAALDETPGLQPTAGVALTVAREQLVSGRRLRGDRREPRGVVHGRRRRFSTQRATSGSAETRPRTRRSSAPPRRSRRRPQCRRQRAVPPSGTAAIRSGA